MRTALLIGLLLAVPAQARDLGQYSTIDPATRACFTSARDAYGTNCCDVSDGSRVEDPDWGENNDGSYWVALDGQQQDVPASAVVPKPCTGYAVIWTRWDWQAGHRKVSCFMAGARS